MKSYVFDKINGYVVHEGPEASCMLYVQNCADLWGQSKDRYTIVTGSKALKELQKEYK